MLIRKHDKTENVIYNKDKKGCKYGVVEKDEIVYINGGRVKEYYIRTAYGYKKLDLENIPHWIAGDIKIDNKEYNIKSYKCELKAEGITIQEKIENYIQKDASQGMIYIVEHNEQIIEIRMTWEEAREFINNFGKIDRGAIRITTCDNKIYNWAIEKIA